jgi:hypothetical protein
VNNLAGSEFLEFTAEVWGNDKDDGNKHKAVKAKKRLLSMFRYGNVLVSQKYSAIQSGLERESGIKIPKSWQYTY